MPPRYDENPLYTPAFKASLRHDYTQTNEPMWSIAQRHGIATRTFEHMVKREDWPRRRAQVRRLIPAQHLLDEANALLAAQMVTPARRPGSPRSACSYSSSRARSARPIETQDRLLEHAEDDPGSRSPASPARLAGMTGKGDDAELVAPPSPPDPAERIERLLIREIEREEARRDTLSRVRRPTAQAAQTARNLAVLTQTLHSLRRLRMGAEAVPQEPEEKVAHEDDLPNDLDEFRRELARRIDAFVASRADAGNAGSDPAALGASA